MCAHHETTANKLLPGEDPILVCVQPVEGLLHIVPQLPGTHLHAGERGGGHPGHCGHVHTDRVPPLRQIVKITGRTGLRMEIGINIFNITLCIDYSKKTTK